MTFFKFELNFRGGFGGKKNSRVLGISSWQIGSFPSPRNSTGTLPPKVESLLPACLSIRQVKVKLFGAEGNRYFVDIFPTKEVKIII